MGKVTISNAAESKPLQDTGQTKDGGGGGIELKKELGLADGVALIIGVIIGAGIFVAPKGVLIHSGSVGLAVVVWIVSGLTSLVGALCYAELGTMIPRSGGDYAYILTAFGGLPAFLFLWVAMLVIVPTGNAILALTFSYYLLQPFYPECGPPDSAVRLISAAVIALLTAVNCYDVKWGARLQTVFTTTKVLAIILIIVTGLVVLLMGKTENLGDPFEGTNYDPGNLSLALYSGLFSYAGWNYLNFVVEEIKDPFKNLPRAIWISLPVVTTIYTLANVAYFVVLSKAELLESAAVAVTFGDQVLGFMSWIMPFFVACSTFGGLNGAIFAPSRLVFVGAREGHLPRALAIINVDTYTPIPALMFLGILSIGMLMIKDVYTLINYMSFVEALAVGVSVFGLLWLRYTQPDAERPIKMPIILPILFSIISIFLIAVPIVTSPASEIGVAVLIVISGIPVYIIFVMWRRKPRIVKIISDKLYVSSSLLFKGVLESSAKGE
ncbi:unnamed protein product [Orchesella dallaii]|uniref:Y+L amino acid transporter 2 n=1 Tax=Orchesella dallaii TaxID=48710 RepID=A0ABP1RTU8_9HEXA